MTDAGQELIANALAGSGTVAFTSVKTSSYAYPNGTNISGLTDIQDIVQSVDPFSAQVFNETMIQVSVRFDNAQVQDEYLIQTLGLYAQVESGSPVLFAVIQADTPDQMPAQSAVSPSAFIYNIQMTVQQATSLNVSVNPAGTATVQDILNLEAAKVDKNGGDLVDTVTTFDDSGSVSGITSFPAFLATFLSNTKTGIFLRNLKAGLQYVLHVGSIVNDCVTNNPSLPLSAAQGKVLMDGKAPNNHASGATTYGLGNAGQYGHVKLSDAYTSSAGNSAAGTGASSYALAQAYSVLNTKLSGKATSGASATFSTLELNGSVPFIDFHYENSSADYTSRIIETAPGIINVVADLKENGNRVATAENTQVKFRNDGGFLAATLDLTDIGCIPTIQGHKMNYSWNSGLQRMYVWMDGIELGYIPFAK